MWDNKSWLPSKELLSMRNMLKHVRLHRIASGNHEKQGEKWLTWSQENFKMSLNFNEAETDLNMRASASFKHIWQRRPRRVYISNFSKIGLCAHLVPFVHLLSLFEKKWLLCGGWFSCAQKGLRAVADWVSWAKN